MNPELVIYSGRGQVLIQKLVDDFQAKTGIKVSVRYDKSTQPGIGLMSEQNQTQADVFFAQTPVSRSTGKKGPLQSSQDLLATVADYTVIPTGIGLNERPSQSSALRPRKFKRNCRPVGRPHQTRVCRPCGLGPETLVFKHMSALRHLGRGKTKQWLKTWPNRNPYSPQNSPQVRGVFGRNRHRLGQPLLSA